MKTGRQVGACIVAGCVGALAICLALIVGLAVLGVWLESVDPGSLDATADAEARTFERAEDDAGFQLSFGFRDHRSQPHQVSCRVRLEDLERELASFGYVEDEFATQLNLRVLEALEAEVRRRNVQDYFRVETHGKGAFRWEWRVPGHVPEPERSRAIAASRRLGGWIDAEFPARHRRMQAALLEPRGFRMKPNGDIAIDYARLVESGTTTLADCHRALVEEGAGSSWPRYLSQFLAFYQDLEYELPPASEDGRFTLGLWVPTEVLVRGRGDCDSKSVALASMLRRFGRRILFILLPKHALIGVEMTPGPGQQFVRLGNRYFVLCDPAGPARIRPGGQAISGSYEYILIEPPSTSL